MTLIKRTPHLFNTFFGRDLFDFENSVFPTPGMTVPAVNVKETTDSFEVEVAAPGFSKKDFHLEVNNNLLTISSATSEKKDETGRYTQKEFSYSSFKRNFTLPENVVNTDKIEARYEDGILYVSLPKLEAAKPKPVRQIAIV